MLRFCVKIVKRKEKKRRKREEEGKEKEKEGLSLGRTDETKLAEW